MNRIRLLRSLATAAVALWVGIGPVHLPAWRWAEAPASGNAATAAEAESASIKGFRSANFGMTEAEVRNAIIKDFKVKPQDIRPELHPTEKTRILSVTTKDLLPDTGAALVVYHFGFKSKTLMQVSIVWGKPIDPSPNPQRLVSTANMLRNYFAAQQFRPEGRLLNSSIEGGIVAFRGFDSDGHMVLLVLSAQPGDASAAPAPGAQAAPAPHPDTALQSLSLQLTYALNPGKPDIFAIEKGQF